MHSNITRSNMYTINYIALFQKTNVYFVMQNAYIQILIFPSISKFQPPRFEVTLNQKKKFFLQNDYPHSHPSGCYGVAKRQSFPPWSKDRVYNLIS